MSGETLAVDREPCPTCGILHGRWICTKCGELIRDTGQDFGICSCGGGERPNTVRLKCSDCTKGGDADSEATGTDVTGVSADAPGQPEDVHSNYYHVAGEVLTEEQFKVRYKTEIKLLSPQQWIRDLIAENGSLSETLYRARRHVDALEKALREVTEELAAWVEDRYPSNHDRDRPEWEPVYRARRLLERDDEEPGA